MGHAPHNHAPRPGPGGERGFALATVLNGLFVVVEGACGLWFGSLALLADAGHNLSDVLGLLLAWGGAYLARRPPSRRRTYGLRRTSIMAALANGLLLLIAVGAIGWEAVQRMLQPVPVAPLPIIAVALLGVVINTLSAVLFLDRHRDLNRRGAFLHMAADAAVSLGVVIGAALIAATGWSWIDPLLSLLIAAVILVGTLDLLWQAIDLAVDAVPRGIEPDDVRNYLLALPGVTSLHDLHIWGMSTTETALTVHLVKPAAEVDDDWLAEIAHELHDRFGIAHATIQLESGNARAACRLAPDDAA
jgi:cobalt-zinc-cadmium efflux system protein